MPFFASKTHQPSLPRAVQDGLFALLIMGVSVTFMLFLLGSTSILTSLSMIGILLCLSLVGGILRFFSMTRADATLGARQDDFDKTLMVLQHRVGDHDLTLLQMAGQIEQVEESVKALKSVQESTAKEQNLFLQTLKNRLVQMMQSMAHMRQLIPSENKVPAAPTSKSAATAQTSLSPAKKHSFFPPASARANDLAPKTADFITTPAPSARLEDDVYVSPTLIREALSSAITQKRIDVYMQPIVTLPQRRIMAYELYGRVRLQPGVYIPATQYRGMSAHGGTQIALDQLVLSELSHLYPAMPDAQVFVNICGDGLTDPSILGLLTQMLKKNPRLRSRLVLEIAQRDCTRLTAPQMKVMRELQKIGVSFAVNDVQGMELDLDLLADLNIRFLKLTYGRFITTHHSDQGAALIHRFITRLRARGIHLIAAHIETQDQIRSMLDYPVMYAQGHLFGRPDRPIAYHLKPARQVA